jgi:hypothetical protein
MKKFNEFIKESKHKDIDPYGEEEWSPRPQRRGKRQAELEEWENRRRRYNEQSLNILRDKCPSAYSNERWGFFELMCDASEFVELVNRKEANFAGNSDIFDDENALNNLISDIQSLSAKDIKIGAIHVHLEDNEINGEAVYFKTDARRRDVRNLMEKYEPNELDRREDNEWRMWWD